MSKSDMYISVKSGVGRLSAIQSRTPTVKPLKVPVESAKALVEAHVPSAVEVNPDDPTQEVPLTLEHINASSDPLVKIGFIPYDSIQKAVDASKPGDIIVLQKDATGNGVVISSGKDITIDFNKHKYTINEHNVGSPGTTTSGFWFEKGSKATLQNGTLDAGSTAKLLIQKYGNLVLDNMNLIGGEQTLNVVSTNNGVTTFKNNTNITAKGSNTAFDAYYWPANGYGDISILTDKLTGKITGKIEQTHDNSTTDEEMKLHSTIKINSGTFTMSIPQEWCAEGFEPKDNQNGTFTVVPTVKGK